VSLESSATRTRHVVVAEPGGNVGPDLATVVFAHGAGGSHLNFYRQIEVLSWFYWVVAWDQRGFGAVHRPDPRARTRPKR